MDFIFQQLLFFISIALVLFIPGYFLLLAVFGKKKAFSDLEKFVIAFGLSIITVDFLMLIIGKVGILFTRLSIISAIIIFSAVCFGIYKLRRKNSAKTTGQEQDVEKFVFSKNQTTLIVLILFLTIFIKTIYLMDTIAPTATDLGHHMYWTKQIIETGKIPIYQKIDIINDSGNYAISEPAKIDDFIIGEHLPFAAVGLISGQTVISAFPSLLLLLINITGILAMFILSISLFKNISYGKSLSIIVLLIAGPLFALSAPQGIYISGGVIGNLLGNLLIPLSFYFFIQGINRNNATFFAVGILSVFGLAYTHHLSTFLLGFTIIAFVLMFLVLQGRQSFSEVKKISMLIFSPIVLTAIILCLAFFFFVHAPAYIENSAVKTVIGEPSRITKAGLSFAQIQSAVGESRITLGIIGIGILLFLSKKLPYQSALILGWFFSVFLLSWKPTLFNIDIPSVRIANYLIFPSILAASFALSWIFSNHTENKKNLASFIDKNILFISFLSLFLFVFFGGMLDNTLTLKSNPGNSKSFETAKISNYLAKKSNSSDIILKDHNYIPSDSWMKLFFMRDYNFPLTRGYLFRYDSPKKEKCTQWMISIPGSPEASKCFTETGVNFIVVNPKNDSAQFEKEREFWKIYSSDSIAAYYRNNK